MLHVKFFQSRRGTHISAMTRDQNQSSIIMWRHKDALPLETTLSLLQRPERMMLKITPSSMTIHAKGRDRHWNGMCNLKTRRTTESRREREKKKKRTHHSNLHLKNHQEEHKVSKEITDDTLVTWLCTSEWSRSVSQTPTTYSAFSHSVRPPFHCFPMLIWSHNP